MCALILWRPGLGLLLVKFCLFLTEVSARHTSIVSFPGDDLRKYQWIFTELDMCIDMVEICFGNANGHISSILTELSARDKSVFLFKDNSLSDCGTPWTFLLPFLSRFERVL